MCISSGNGALQFPGPIQAMPLFPFFLSFCPTPVASLDPFAPNAPLPIRCPSPLCRGRVTHASPPAPRDLWPIFGAQVHDARARRTEGERGGGGEGLKRAVTSSSSNGAIHAAAERARPRRNSCLHKCPRTDLKIAPLELSLQVSSSSCYAV